MITILVDHNKVLRAENNLDSLPVLTIGKVDRMKGSAYLRRCATSLVDIVLDLANYKGVGRIFIP